MKRTPTHRLRDLGPNPIAPILVTVDADGEVYTLTGTNPPISRATYEANNWRLEPLS